MTYKQHFEMGEKQYIQERYKEALDEFKFAYSIEKKAECLNYMGCCYFDLKDYDSSIEKFELAKIESPNWERPVFNLGRVFLQLGDEKKALECFEVAYLLNPEEEDTLYYLGVYYRKIEKYENAIMYYTKSLAINKNQPETLVDLGICFAMLKQSSHALGMFERALSCDPNCFDAAYNCGRVLISTGAYQEALNVLLKFEESNGNNPELLMQIAHCYYKSNDFQKALLWAKKVTQISPQHHLALLLIKKSEKII